MKSIQEGLEANDQMNKAVEHIKSSGTVMADAIQKLIEANQSIATIIRDLSEISLQTKILALNAGVEAAHAGERGATFAVVAEQIKEIAERCKTASEKTGAIIRNSLSTSESAIAAGKQIEDDIQNIVYHQYEITEVLNGYVALEKSGDPKATVLAAAAAQSTNKNRLVFDVASMSTGNYEVDQQHRNLIDMINQLEEAVEQGRGREGVDRLLNFLGDYATKHFTMEEVIMEKSKCPAREDNCKAHRAMAETFRKWRENYDKQGFNPKLIIELKEILSKWLVGHICKIDCQLRAPAEKTAHAPVAA